MLIEFRAPASQLPEPSPRERTGERARGGTARQTSPGARAVSVLAFAAAVGMVLAYALPGGTYDVVIRQEYGVVLWWGFAVAVACGLLPRVRPSRLTVVVLGALGMYA